MDDGSEGEVVPRMLSLSTVFRHLPVGVRQGMPAGGPEIRVHRGQCLVHTQQLLWGQGLVHAYRKVDGAGRAVCHMARLGCCSEGLEVVGEGRGLPGRYGGLQSATAQAAAIGGVRPQNGLQVVFCGHLGVLSCALLVPRLPYLCLQNLAT